MLQPTAPPSYDTPSPPAIDDAFDLQPELPIYTRGPPSPPPSQVRIQRHPKEFTYDLKQKGKPWAVLTVTADPVLSKQMPTILEGSKVAGSVTLDAENGNHILAVIVSVQGNIIIGANRGEQSTFLDVSVPLWQSSDEGHTGKLEGHFNWPFSIQLPKDVVVKVGPHHPPQPFRLPQTFLERFTRTSVQYQICVRFVRSKLRTNNEIVATFGYIPVTRPDKPSLLRQLAYQENSPLLGPSADPDGWNSFESVIVRGKVFNNRTVDLKCTFSLAKPLCYTRGTAIPCTITIDSEDMQALDLVSSSLSINVRLRRRVSHFVNSESVLAYAWKDEIEHSRPAVWWPSTEGSSDDTSSQRHLNGEIHLPPDLKPSSAMGHFRVDYSVVLFPFIATTFEPADSHPLLIAPVEIATAYAMGPRPRIYAPPDYEPSTSLAFFDEAYGRQVALSAFY